MSLAVRTSRFLSLCAGVLWIVPASSLACLRTRIPQLLLREHTAFFISALLPVLFLSLCTHHAISAPQLLLRVHTAFFTAGSVVASHRDPADSLLVLLAGRIGVYLPGRNHRLFTLEPGCAGAGRGGGLAGALIGPDACDQHYKLPERQLCEMPSLSACIQD